MDNSAERTFLMTFHEIYQDIWAGSPATTGLASTFDSSVILEENTVEVENEINHINYIFWYISIRFS